MASRLSLLSLLVVLPGISQCESEDVDDDGWSTTDGDCNDDDAAVYPGAQELCNWTDDDCDGTVDNGAEGRTLYRDADGDGAGAASSGTISSCHPPSGYVLASGDCDDSRSDVIPGGQERCDGRDNDCDGRTDDQDDVRVDGSWFYPDRDGDGFGVDAERARRCAAATGWITVTGDCDDSRASVHPGADDSSNDGLDADCGGTDAMEPRVGLGSGASPTVQAALDAAVSGQTVWVGPGTYLEADITPRGKAVALRATHGPSSTVINAQSRSNVLTFSSGEGAGTVVSGFTFQGGKATYTDCAGSGSCALVGGGALILATSPTLERCVFLANDATNGGGLYARDSDSQLTELVFQKNHAGAGGGAFLRDGAAVVRGCTFVENTAYEGGGLYFANEFGETVGNTFTNNYAETMGGAMSSRSAGELIRNNLVVNNRSKYSGAGLYIQSSTGRVEQNSFVSNLAETYTTSGGGIDSNNSSAPLINNALVNNLGYNLYVTGTVNATYNVLSSPVGLNVNTGGLSSTNLDVAPGYVRFRPAEPITRADFRLRETSLLRHAGDPATTNPDGSRADIGHLGGPAADFLYYADADADGLPDGWEQSFGLSLSTVSGVSDPDGDGMSCLDELRTATHPLNPDTDRDGADDGLETRQGSDADDYFKQPGIDQVIATVPGSFATLQDGLNALVHEGHLQLGAGTYSLSGTLQGGSLTLEGPAGAAATVITPPAGQRVLDVQMTTLSFKGLTFTGADLEGSGGILAGRAAVVRITDAVLSNNTVTSSGGVLHLQMNSTLTLENSTLNDNRAGGYGGVIYLASTLSTVHRCTFQRNFGGIGQVLRSNGDTLTVTDCLIQDNTGTYDGAMSLNVGTYELHGNQWLNNLKGALILDGADAVISHDLYYGNQAGLATVYILGADVQLSHSVFANNTHTSTEGGAIVFKTDYNGSADINHNLLLDNSPYSMSSGAYYPTDMKFEYNSLYSTVGANTTGIQVDSTNVEGNPGLLRYTTGADVTAQDFHLALSSPLVNAGNSRGKDVDGSPLDIGLYGNDGDTLDWDRDDVTSYFWPGTLSDAPNGYSPSDYDANDRDASID